MRTKMLVTFSRHIKALNNKFKPYTCVQKVDSLFATMKTRPEKLGEPLAGVKLISIHTGIKSYHSGKSL